MMNPSNKKMDKRLELLERSVRSHHSFLLRYAYRILGNWADAEDVVSELWAYAMERLGEEHIGCLPVLRKKAYFLSLDCLRRRGRKEVLSEEFDRMPMQASPFEAFTEEEERSLAERFWSELGPVPLTDEQRLATWLALRYGYTYDEISSRLGSSRSTVGDWVARGKRIIREALE